MFRKNNKGFLLEDALISVMIVSVISLIVSTSVLSHYKVEESVESQCQQESEKTENLMLGKDACIICTEEPVESADAIEESY